MFLMAQGLSPVGEINMGKRLKPQAFFHNLLPSSFFPCSGRAGPAQQSLIQNQTHPVSEAYKSQKNIHKCSNIDTWAMAAMGRKARDKERGDLV